MNKYDFLLDVSDIWDIELDAKFLRLDITKKKDNEIFDREIYRILEQKQEEKMCRMVRKLFCGE